MQKRRNTIRSKQAFVAAGRPRSQFSRLLDIRLANLLLLAVAVSLFVAYLGLNTQTATKGFILREIEQKITRLQERKQKLDLEQVMNQSMDNIEAEVQQGGFVPVAGVDYIDAGDSAVSMRTK